MKRVLFLAVVCGLVLFAEEAWQAMVMPNAAFYCIIKCDKFPKSEKDVDDDKLESDACEEQLKKNASLLSIEQQKNYDALSDILKDLAKQPSCREKISTFRMCDNLLEDKGPAACCTFKEAMKLSEFEAFLKEESKVTQCTLGKMAALKIVEDEAVFYLFLADNGKLLFLTSEKQGNDVVARLESKKYAPLSPEMQYLIKTLPGDIQFSFEITEKIRAAVMAKAQAAMEKEPMQAMLIMKLAKMTGVVLSAGITKDADNQDCLYLNLGLCNTSPEAAAVVKREFYDGMIIPMAKSLGEAFAPGQNLLTNSLSSSTKERLAVLSLKMTKQQCELFNKK